MNSSEERLSLKTMERLNRFSCFVSSRGVTYPVMFRLQKLPPQVQGSSKVDSRSCQSLRSQLEVIEELTVSPKPKDQYQCLQIHLQQRPSFQINKFRIKGEGCDQEVANLDNIRVLAENLSNGREDYGSKCQPEHIEIVCSIVWSWCGLLDGQPSL